MSARYYIYANNRWCELNTETGRVNGWRQRVQFAYSNQGKLEIANTGRLLRHLRAHAAGQPSDVRDSYPLSFKLPKKKKRLTNASKICHHHCCERENAIPNFDRSISLEKQISDATHKAPNPDNERNYTQKDDNNKEISNNMNRTAYKALTPQSIKLTDIEVSSSDNDIAESCKELIIDERDVSLLRSFLKKNLTDLDLKEFDDDENFRKEVFFKINPLVLLEKDPKVRKLVKDMEAKRKRDLAIIEFANKLGLRKTKHGVSKSKIDKGANGKIKKNYDKNLEAFKADKHLSGINNKKKKIDSNEQSDIKSNTESTDKYISKQSEVENDVNFTRKTRSLEAPIGNSNNTITRLTRSSLNLKNVDSSKSEIVHSQANKKPLKQFDANTKNKDISNSQYISLFNVENNNIIIKKVNDGSVSNKNCNRESDEKILLKSPIRRRKDGRYGNHITYSIAEDKAIVKWIIAEESRARRVNGNKVWRNLELDYERMTGINRSWHSLRNRYLRYLLPGLTQLRLPSDKAAFLRAAAAKGEIKVGNGNKRNSIFARPTISSASLRLRRLRLENESSKTQHASEVTNAKPVITNTMSLKIAPNESNSNVSDTDKNEKPSPKRFKTNKSFKSGDTYNKKDIDISKDNGKYDKIPHVGKITNIRSSTESETRNEIKDSNKAKSKARTKLERNSVAMLKNMKRTYLNYLTDSDSDATININFNGLESDASGNSGAGIVQNFRKSRKNSKLAGKDDAMVEIVLSPENKMEFANRAIPAPKRRKLFNPKTSK